MPAPEINTARPGIQNRVSLAAQIILACAIVLLGVLLYQYSSTEKRMQRQILEAAGQHLAWELEQHYALLHRSIYLFAQNHESLLQEVIRNPRDPQPQERIKSKIKRLYPEAFAVTLADAEGHLFMEDYDNLIDNACRSDLEHFARTSVSPEPYIHPNPEGYHFDVMVRLQQDQQKPHIFFVSFLPDVLANIIDKNDATHPDVDFLLVKRNGQDLIEVGARGSRQSLQREFFLSPQERDAILLRLPLQYTQWDLVALHSDRDLAVVELSRLSTTRNVSAVLLMLAGLAALLMLFRSDRLLQKQNHLVRQQTRELHDSHETLSAIRDVQDAYITSPSPAEVFNQILEYLLRITQSEYGFIGERLCRADGMPYLKTHAITNIDWNDDTRRFYEENTPQGSEFHNLDTLFGEVLKTGQELITNSPASHTAGGGLPPGHPPLKAFLGIPIYHGNAFVGMVGLANRPSGYSMDLLYKLMPLVRTCGTIIEAYRDEQKRVQTERALQESEARVRTVLDNMVDGMITIDTHGIIQSANRATERIFGYRLEELLGRNVSLLMPEPHHSDHDAYLQRYLETGEAHVIGSGREVSGQRKDGSQFPMELSVSEITLQNQRMFAGMVRDITERKKVEKLKKEFISTVSHELRTPLTSIRGSLGLLLHETEALSEKHRMLLEIANQNSKRLLLLINDILDMEKIESGELQLKLVHLPLAEFLHDALRSLAGYAQEHQVRFRLEGEIPEATLYADRDRLMQIMSNLLSNAAKFSPPDSSVQVSTHQHDHMIRIQVRDQGSGIPLEFQNRIFQKFAQADATDTRKSGGTGLGLSITKSLVERHGGHIGFTSQPGEGTTFYVDLPDWNRHIRSGTASAARKNILICEDDADTAYVLQALLDRAGYHADIATTAQQAHERLQAQDYAAMTLDILLPDRDGITLLQELRAEDRTRDLPVIVISAHADEARQRINGTAARIVNWLTKPIDEEALKRSLRKLSSLHGHKSRILHVEDDADVFQVTRTLLGDAAELVPAASLGEARRRLAEQHYDAIILDLELPDGNGLDLLQDLDRDEQGIPVVLYTAQESSSQIAHQVSAHLVKARTGNEELQQTILNLIRKSEAEGSGAV